MDWYPLPIHRRVSRLERLVEELYMSEQQLEAEVAQLGPELDALATEIQQALANAGTVPQSVLDSVQGALDRIKGIGASLPQQPVTPSPSPAPGPTG